MLTVLCRVLANSLRRSSAGVGHVQLVVPVDRAGDLEAGRAEQADTLPDRPVERDHDLRGQQAVVAGAALGRVGDPVAEEVLRPDPRPGRPGSGCWSSRR